MEKTNYQAFENLNIQFALVTIQVPEGLITLFKPAKGEAGASKTVMLTTTDIVKYLGKQSEPIKLKILKSTNYTFKQMRKALAKIKYLTEQGEPIVANVFKKEKYNNVIKLMAEQTEQLMANILTMEKFYKSYGIIRDAAKQGESLLFRAKL